MLDARRSKTMCCPDLAWPLVSVGSWRGGLLGLLGLLGAVLGRGLALEPGRASPNRGCQRSTTKKKNSRRKRRTKTTPKKETVGLRPRESNTRQLDRVTSSSSAHVMLPCPSPLPSRPSLQHPLRCPTHGRQGMHAPAEADSRRCKNTVADGRLGF